MKKVIIAAIGIVIAIVGLTGVYQLGKNSVETEPVEVIVRYEVANEGPVESEEEESEHYNQNSVDNNTENEVWVSDEYLAELEMNSKTNNWG